MSDGESITLTITQVSDYEFRVRFDDTPVADLLTDESPPIGRDAGPSPTRLLGAAIGNCLGSSLLFALRKYKNTPGIDRARHARRHRAQRARPPARRAHRGRYPAARSRRGICAGRTAPRAVRRFLHGHRKRARRRAGRRSRHAMRPVPSCIHRPCGMNATTALVAARTQLPSRGERFVDACRSSIRRRDAPRSSTPCSISICRRAESRPRSVQRVLEYVATTNLELEWVLETHAHADHLSAGGWIADRTGAKLAIGADIVEVQKNFKRILNLERCIRHRRLAIRPSFRRRRAIPHRRARSGSHRNAGPYAGQHRVSRRRRTLRRRYAVRARHAARRAAIFPAATRRRSIARSATMHALPDSTRVFLCHDYPAANAAPRAETDIASREKLQHPCVRDDQRSRIRRAAHAARRDARRAVSAVAGDSVQYSRRAIAAQRNGRRFVLQAADHVRGNVAHPTNAFHLARSRERRPRAGEGIGVKRRWSPEPSLSPQPSPASGELEPHSDQRLDRSDDVLDREAEVLEQRLGRRRFAERVDADDAPSRPTYLRQ